MALVDVGSAVARTLHRSTGFTGKAFTLGIWFKCLSYPGTGSGNAFIGAYLMDAAWGLDNQAPGAEGPFVSTHIQVGDTDNGPENDITAPGASFTGWQIVFIVCDSSGNCVVYTGTESVAPATGAVAGFSLPNPSTDVYVGNGGAGLTNRNGKYAIKKLWSVALTSGEVAAEWPSATPVKTASLFQFWSGATGTTIGQDTSGGSHDDTVVGTGFTLDTDMPSTAKVLAAAQGGLTLTGQAAALRRGRALTCASGSFALTGKPVNLVRGKRLVCAQGSLAMTGETVALRSARSLGASQGSISFTGNAVTLTKTTGARVLSAAQGSFALTGEAVALRKAKTLTVASGAFALSGFGGTSVLGYVLSAAQGSFALTGEAVGLKRARVLSGGQGSFTVTGNAAVLTKSGARVLTAGQGSVSLAGQAVNLGRGRIFSVASGNFALSGASSTLTRGRKLSAAQGSIALTGESAAFRRATVAPMAAGSFSATGVAAALSVQHAGSLTLSAGQGIFSLTGEPVAGQRALHAVSSVGAFVLTGEPITPRAGRALPASAGSLSMSGRSLAFLVGRRLPCAAGSFGMTGNAASLTRHSAGSYELTAAPGAFALTGYPVSLFLGMLPTTPRHSAAASGSVGKRANT